MAEVFVSYKRDDLAAVSSIVAGLRGEGITTWWDRDIAPGAPWETTIERELDRARVTLVAWSPAAVASENVKGEARFARNRGKLIQLYVARCTPPIFFGERQGVELLDWTGDRDDPRFRSVLAAIRAMLAGETPAEGVGYNPPRSRWRGPAIAAGIALVIAAALVFGYPRQPDRPAVRSPRAPVETIVSRRQLLLRSLGGSWDRQDGDCAAPTVIETSVDPARGEIITVRNRDGFRGVGAIIAAENGAVISRDLNANANGRREQWEYRPVGNDMTVVDGAGVATKLVRCGDAPRPAAGS